jgi:hypothetical protein
VRLASLLMTLFLVACGEGSDSQLDMHAANVADMSRPLLPLCPPGAGALHAAKCDPRVDTECDCHAQGDCYTAQCLCDGYWEADQILVICDGGARD